MRLTDNIKRISFDTFIKHCVVSLITAWCFVSCVNMIRLSSEIFNPVESLATVGYTSIAVYVAVILVVAAVLTAFSLRSGADKIMNYIMFVSALVCGLVIVSLKQDVYTCLAVSGLVLLAFLYASRDMKVTDIVISRKCMIILIAVAAALIAVFIGVTAVYRYITYNVPNFDGGLFFQMFYYMKNHLTMQTTLERDVLMSHFKVHTSPVFWLLFPVYYVFPYPQTIQICQGFVLASAVIPLSLLCNKKGISRAKTVVICCIYCFMPYVAGGCGYDVHENMFLPVAIFTLLYAFERNSWKCIIPALIFLLSVKEDAAVYAGFIGMYMLVSRDRKDKSYIKSVAVMLVAVIYFAITVTYIKNAGFNTATDRFNNMIYGHDGNVLGMIPTIFINPGYTIAQIMSDGNIRYIITVLAPMLFLPLYCRDYRLYILAGPFLMFNLMPSYEYLHDINFQYTFGSATLLFYMAVLCIQEDRKHNPLKTLCMMGIVTGLFFTSGMISRFDYINMYNNSAYRQIYEEINESLSHIPDDAEVTAGTFLCSHLSQRDIIYEDYYTDKETEYLALDLRGTEYDYDVSEFYESKGYETLSYKEGIIAVFRKRQHMISLRL